MVFLAIGSSASNSALRQALRDTWLGQWVAPEPRLEYRFFIDVATREVDEEAREHGDMVIMPFNTSGHRDFSRWVCDAKPERGV